MARGKTWKVNIMSVASRIPGKRLDFRRNYDVDVLYMEYITVCFMSVDLMSVVVKC